MVSEAADVFNKGLGWRETMQAFSKHSHGNLRDGKDLVGGGGGTNSQLTEGLSGVVGPSSMRLKIWETFNSGAGGGNKGNERGKAI